MRKLTKIPRKVILNDQQKLEMCNKTLEWMKRSSGYHIDVFRDKCFFIGQTVNMTIMDNNRTKLYLRIN